MDGHGRGAAERGRVGTRHSAAAPDAGLSPSERAAACRRAAAAHTADSAARTLRLENGLRASASASRLAFPVALPSKTLTGRAAAPALLASLTHVPPAYCTARPVCLLPGSDDDTEWYGTQTIVQYVTG